MVKPLHCCLLLTAAVATPAICAFSTRSSIRPTKNTSIRRTSSTTVLFSSISGQSKVQENAALLRQPIKSKEQQEKEKREEEQREGFREAREDARQLRSLFKEDEDNASRGPTISELEPEQIRQLRREIIGRRRRRQNEKEDEIRDRQDYLFIITALVPCLLAFFSWDELSMTLAQWLEHAAIGQSVDGNRFASDLLRPTITGVVVPVISIALATLVSTTVNVLRARQVDLRALICKEACDLRLLRRAIFGMFGTRQHAGRRSRAFTLLKRYIDQINRECNAGAIESLQVLELSGGVATNELDELCAMLHGVDGAAVSRQGSVSSADDIISRLNQYRSDRVSLLLTDFPDLHWIVLAALSVSICVTFLLESNQLVNQVLTSSSYVRINPSVALLVGVFSATATLCIDLADPFSGSFSVAGSTAQVGDLRLCLLEDVREAKSEASELSSSTFRFFRSPYPEEEKGTTSSGRPKPMKGPSRRDTSPSRYGNNFLSTVYFHLLTGPLGSNVRAVGEILAWAMTLVWKKTRPLLVWRRWPWVKKESKRPPGLP
ncbi:hypothetical protein ACHAXR_004564 [Thalassiosira sp. AJA248-18]